MSLISGITIDAGSILGQVGQLAKDIRTAITGKEILDPTKLAELEKRALEIEAAASSAQTDINKVEASSSSMFIAGGRPFVIWVCGFAFAWQFLLGPIATWVLTICNVQVTLPTVDATLMIDVLFALLGISGLRTYEKYKGVQGQH
jgi:hypothetical protein